jgi:hypothetical protein
VAATVCGAPPVAPVSIFDGKTLDGWLQIENSATSLSTAGIVDPAAFVGKLANGSDAVSVYLRSRLSEAPRSPARRFMTRRASPVSRCVPRRRRRSRAI